MSDGAYLTLCDKLNGSLIQILLFKNCLANKSCDTQIKIYKLNSFNSSCDLKILTKATDNEMLILHSNKSEFKKDLSRKVK